MEFALFSGFIAHLFRQDRLSMSMMPQIKIIETETVILGLLKTTSLQSAKKAVWLVIEQGFYLLKIYILVHRNNIMRAQKYADEFKVISFMELQVSLFCKLIIFHKKAEVFLDLCLLLSSKVWGYHICEKFVRDALKCIIFIC